MDEYLIQGSTLTDIADAIREKTGDDALMTPAEMVEAIGSISGGGLPEGINAVATGTFSVTSSTGSKTIVHNLGVIPRVFAIVAECPWYPNLNTNMIFACFGVIRSGYTSFGDGKAVKETTINTGLQTGSSGTWDASETTVVVRRWNATRGSFQPNMIVDSEGNTIPITYRWYAIG